MGEKIVYFDLETRKLLNDVGGWGNRDKLGISVGVSYSTAEEQYHIFRQEEAEALVQQLLTADLVVGFNHLSFDYGVLQPFSILTLEEQTRNLDLMVSLEEKLGHRISLDAVATATLGLSKVAVGTEAVLWWRDYEKTQKPEPMNKIAHYCAYDVKVTKAVHEFGRREGHIVYRDKAGRDQRVEVAW